MISVVKQTNYDIYGIQSVDTNKRVPKNQALSAKQQDNKNTQSSSNYLSNAVDKKEYALFESINQQKTLENAYTLFSQLAKNLPSKDSYTRKEVMNVLPFAFDYDTKTFQITKTYTLQEYQDKVLKNQQNDKNIKTMMTFYQSYSDIQNLKQDDIFQSADKETFNKNDIFNAFYRRNFNSPLLNSSPLIEGETTIRGKLEGLDKNLSDDKLKDLRKFLDKNKLGNGDIFLWIDSGDELEYQQLLNSNLSIDEFKEKYLKFKEKVEDKQELWHKSSQDELQKELGQTAQNSGADKINGANSNANSTASGSANLASKTSANGTTSKSEIFKDMDLSRLQSVLKNQHKFDLISILFGANSSGVFGGSNSKDLNTNLMNLNLSQIKPLNKVDIKA